MYSKEALLKRRAELSAAKQALLTQQLRGDATTPASLSTTIPKRPALAQIPLSSIQERFWFLQQLDPTSTHYIGVIVYRMTCRLSLAALAQTARKIVRRHEILRTTYQVVEGQVYQVVDPSLHQRLRVPVLDLQGLPPEQQQQLVEQIISREQQRPLLLTEGVPWSATVLRLASEYHISMLRVHHLIGDGWTIDALVHRELITTYRACAAGQSAPLPDLPIQYADYAYWQRQRLQAPDFAVHREYWRSHLRGAPHALRLPIDHPRPPMQQYREAAMDVRLTETLVDQLKALGQPEQVTLFMTLLAAFAVLLARYSGQEDVVVGTSVAGREYPELEELLGCFINTLPLRLNLSGQPSFCDLLARVRTVCLNALAHQDMPVEQIVAEVQPPRDLSRSILFQVMFQLQNFPHFPPQPEEVEHVIGRADTEVAAPVVGQGQCDLMLILSESGAVQGTLVYDATLFEAATVARLCGHFVTLLEGIIASPQRPVMSISLLRAAEREEILRSWNATEQAPPPLEVVHQLVTAQVARTPDAVAAVFAEQQLTYQELNRRAYHLAHYLQTLGVGPEVQVGLCMERSLELVVGLLGILNAGGAYVPLDPHYPRQRLAFMLEDTQLEIVLTQERQRDLLPNQRARIVCVDAAWPTIAQTPAMLPPSKVTGQHLAYVIYTSGASGQPKGVMVQHQSLVNFSQVAGAAYAITPADRVLQFASICFDTSAEEIYPCLVHGATLVLRTESMLDSVEVFLEKCREWALTMLDLPTAYWHELVGHLSRAALRLLPPIRLVIIGGERALPERLATWQQYAERCVRLVNTYGPTETTIVATLADLSSTLSTPSQWQEVPIGQALRYTQVYILDRDLDPVPLGVPGELHIGGAGVARGYLNRADLTAERFVPNPFREGIGDGGWGMEEAPPSPIPARPLRYACPLSPGTRLYRTGDRARYLADGTIEFLGRYDRQVKIRGYRIEPGEIEAALARHTAVQAAAVVEQADGLGGTQLVAYVVTSNKSQVTSAEDSSLVTRHSLLVTELRSFLMQQLPLYMLPAALMELDTLPLTPNGKLDRQALPAPDDAATPLDFDPPQTTVEQLLAELWGSVLERERIGRSDNFFALGGHSLLGSQLIYRITEVFALALPLRSLFQEPTLADLALAIEEGWLAEISAHDQVELLGLPASWPAPPADPLVDPLVLHADPNVALLTAMPEADPARAQRREQLTRRQAQLPPAQQALLSARERHARTARARGALPTIPPRPAEAPVPLAFAQEALWLQEQLTPGTTLYNISRVERLHGALDRAALEQSLQTLVQRHEPLRTHFTTMAGQPVQVIAPSVPFALALLDLRDVAPEQQESAAREFVARVQRPFALDQAPLLRVALVQLADSEHVLLITLHHLIADGWSLGVFFRDLTQLYSAAIAGRAATLPALPVQYGDYAVWQRSWLQGPVLDAQLAYWKQQLAGAPALLTLPYDHARPPQPTLMGGACRLAVPEAVQQALRQLSQELRATLFMTLLAAWQSLLGRLSGQEDIVVGVPVAGRGRAELDEMIGCFINTLVLRSDVRGRPTFREFVARVREVCLEGYAHQELPFGKLLEALQPSRTLSHSPLFQVLFDLHNTVSAADVQIDITGTSIEQTTSTVNYDLTLLLHDNVGRLTGMLEYSRDLFEAVTVERLCGHFLTLLEGIAADPNRRLSDLPLLNAAERQQLLVDWNATAADYPQNQCIHHLFEAQVARGPDAVAVVLGEQQVTYQELNRRANQLAYYLDSLGVGAEVLIGLCVRRSMELAVGMLGILKAGAAYLPLDPDYPQERLTFLLADSQAPVLLTQASLLPRLPEWGAAPPQHTAPRHLAANRWPPTMVCLDRDWASIAALDEATLPSDALPASTATAIYTSGSTGRPKGVLIPHQALVNYTLAMLPRLELQAQDRFLQFAALGFDVVLEELLPTWASGATVVLHDAELLSPADTFGQLLVRSGVTVVELPAHYWQAWVYELTQTNATVPAWLRLVLVGCEQPTPASLVAWQQFGISLIHVYGLSETTITTSLYHMAAGGEAAPPRPLPLGRPIANTQLYVLDPQMQPVPLGVPGELYIGGAGLARGYLHRAELTAERFVPNPFWGMGDGGWGRISHPPSPIPHPPSPGTRLYKTGDLVRYQTDGNIEFLGRYDRQVKLHGYRIELGEIEAALAQHAAVHVAAVVQRADRLGGTQLVAYVVTSNKSQVTSAEDSSLVTRHSLLVSELRGFLKEQLPAYMLPAAYVMLEALPLTPNGKLDHRALPLLDLADTEQAVPFVAPRSPTEEAMAEIWKQILRLERVGVHDNFFDLGGHSILMSQLMFKVQEVFLVDLPWRSLFEAPTVADLTRAVELARVTGSSGIATKETAIDLNAEVVLDPSISAKGPFISPVTADGSIFLTGASGFLGAFLLHELLQRTSATVYCLVRAPQLEEGSARLQSALENYLLWDAQFSARIIPVLGDLAKPRLGLAPREFERIANTVETIYHNGALVNFLYPYKNLKPANVLGTQEVLRMASLGSVKPVHYISTLSVIPAAEPSDNHIREHDPLPHSHKLEGGYAQSKWVAEQLVALAHTRGIPVSIYRPGHLTGDSQTGACNPNDLFGHLLKSSIQMGGVPNLDTQLEWTPVDYVSKAIVHLAQQPDSYGRTYHLFNPQRLPFSELVAYMQRRGYPLRLLEQEQWRQELVQALNNSQENALHFLSGPLLEQESSAAAVSEEGATREEPQIDCQSTLDALATSGIACPAIDAQILDVYFTFFTRTKFLDTPAGVVRPR